MTLVCLNLVIKHFTVKLRFVSLNWVYCNLCGGVGAVKGAIKIHTYCTERGAICETKEGRLFWAA